jgi:predicted site-specific integrase-resolvase
MPVVIKNQTYYRTAEVCRIAGISRNTLFKWLKEGVLSDVEYRDCRGWRLFTPAQLETLRTNTNHVVAVSRRGQGSMQTEETP